MKYRITKTFRDDSNKGKWYSAGDVTSDDLSKFAPYGLVSATFDAAESKGGAENAEKKGGVENATAPGGKAK